MEWERSTGLELQDVVVEYYNNSDDNSTLPNSSENILDYATNLPSLDSDEFIELETGDFVNNSAAILSVINESNSKNVSDLEFNSITRNSSNSNTTEMDNSIVPEIKYPEVEKPVETILTLNTTTNLKNLTDLKIDNTFEKPQEANTILNSTNSKKPNDLEIEETNNRLLKLEKILKKISSENSKYINLPRNIKNWLSTLTELVLTNTKLNTMSDVKCTEPCDDDVQLELTLKQSYLVKKLQNLIQKNAIPRSPFVLKTRGRQGESKAPRKKLPLMED
ncbi:hypothetical protein PV325_012467 [Microctonus aethiopoides]|nr:hypothetical protein PV325_012467 [Microctonus aethiopoides]